MAALEELMEKLWTEKDKADCQKWRDEKTKDWDEGSAPRVHRRAAAFRARALDARRGTASGRRASHLHRIRPSRRAARPALSTRLSRHTSAHTAHTPHTHRT